MVKYYINGRTSNKMQVTSYYVRQLQTITKIWMQTK